MKISVIHIFKYGEVQIISPDFNFKAAFSDLKTLDKLVDFVLSQNPDTTPEYKFHAINIYPDRKIDCIAIGINKNTSTKYMSFSIENNKINYDFVTNLVEELMVLKADKDKIVPVTIKKK